MKNLRKEFYELVTEYGFYNALDRFNKVLKANGYEELPPSDLGKFLQGSPTRKERQGESKIARKMPKIQPRVCHSLRVCYGTPDARCMDSECPVNKKEV